MRLYWKIVLITVVLCLAPLVKSFAENGPQFGNVVIDTATMPISWYKSNCVIIKDKDVDMTEMDYQVNEFGYIGSMNDKDLYYCLYKCFLKSSESDLMPKANNSMIAIFEGLKRTKNITPVFALFNGGEPGISSFDKPKIYHKAVGYILYMPNHGFGTGNYDCDHYILSENGQWKLIERKSWVKEIDTKLPKDYEIRKGIEIDFGKMKAYSYVWRKEDAPGDSPRGNIDCTLEIKDNRFVLKDFKYINSKTSN